MSNTNASLVNQQISIGTGKKPGDKECVTVEPRPDERHLNLTDMAIEDASIMVEAYNGINFLKR